jgi:hypothetical protein
MTATTHVETTQLPGRRLGRRAPKNADHLKLADLLTGVVPAHPATDDNLSRATYGLYQNDRFGDCGPTSAANMRRQITMYLTGVEHDPTQDDVFALYRASGNPNFDPTTGADDNGVDMQTMCEALTTVGIGGVKALAFAKVDHTNLDEVKAAVAIFGGLLLGVNLETAQQTQTDNGVWDVQQSPEWGGHEILAGAYRAVSSGADVTVITWAQTVGLTDRFWEQQVEEAWVVVWPEHLGHVAFLEGVDQAALAADYTALTGRPFPVQPSPQPVPGPAPVPAPPVVDPADQALVATLRPWLNEHHTGDNRRAVTAVRTWMATKALS